MKGLLYYCLTFSILLASNAYSQQHYTTGTGNWDGDPIWGSATTGVGVPWSLRSVAAGDTIVIDDDIILNTHITINVDVHIIIDATLDMHAHLRLTANSTIEFTSNGRLTSTATGDGSKISFGGTEVWDPSQGDVVGPGIMDQNYNGTLPVALLAFSGSSKNDEVVLNWKTASEVNNDYFTLARSLDGIAFKDLTTINGAGNSTEPINYSYRDLRPSYGRAYYRLSQTDLDGTTEVLGIVSIDFTTIKELAVHPNPVRQGGSLNIQTGATAEENVNVSIYTMSGMHVRNEQVKAFGEINIARLQAGSYVLKVTSGQTSKSARLVIQ